MAIYDALDARFAWNGDLLLDNGDIKDNSENRLLWLLDQIHSICASVFEDWELYPNRAANLDKHIGEPNTRERGALIQRDIVNAITSAGLVQSSDLDVRVVPVHIYKVLVIIKIKASPTINNNLVAGELLQVALIYDSFEQQLYYIDKVPQLITPGG